MDVDYNDHHHHHACQCQPFYSCMSLGRPQASPEPIIVNSHRHKQRANLLNMSQDGTATASSPSTLSSAIIHRLASASVCLKQSQQSTRYVQARRRRSTCRCCLTATELNKFTLLRARCASPPTSIKRQHEFPRKVTCESW